MVLRTRAGNTRGETVDDLCTWLQRLDGPRPVDETVVLGCDEHGGTRPTWVYVEADPRAGVARRRCLSCATSVGLLDSDDRWTWPPMWACLGCGHSIAEVVAGLSLPDGERVDWVVLAARCVECGTLSGLTDLVVADVPRADVVARL